MWLTEGFKGIKNLPARQTKLPRTVHAFLQGRADKGVRRGTVYWLKDVPRSMDESFQRPDTCKTSVKLVDVLKIVAFAVIQLDAGPSVEVGARRPNFGI